MDPRQTQELAAAIAALAGMVARTLGAAPSTSDGAGSGEAPSTGAGDGSGSPATAQGGTGAQGAGDAAGDDGPLVGMGRWLADLRNVCDRLEEAESDRERVDVPDDGASLSEWSDFASECGGETVYRQAIGGLEDTLADLRETLGLMSHALDSVADVAAQVAARHPGDKGAQRLARALARG
jgi:hypothetical protein